MATWVRPVGDKPSSVGKSRSPRIAIHPPTAAANTTTDPIAAQSRFPPANQAHEETAGRAILTTGATGFESPESVGEPLAATGADAALATVDLPATAGEAVETLGVVNVVGVTGVAGVAGVALGEDAAGLAAIAGVAATGAAAAADGKADAGDQSGGGST
jgi:hypothetical protein